MSVSELYIEAKPLGLDGAKRSQTPSAQRNRITELPHGFAATELPNYRITELPNYRGQAATEPPSGKAATD